MGILFTGRFRHWMRKRSPSKCCKLLVSAGTVFCGKIGRKSGSCHCMEINILLADSMCVADECQE